MITGIKLHGSGLIGYNSYNLIDLQKFMTDIHDIIAERRKKLAAIRETGQAFPNTFKPENYSQDLHQAYGEETKESLEEKSIAVKVAGRIMTRRLMGKASFTTIQDKQGQIQFYISKNDVGEACYEAFKHWDLGDIVGLSGTLFKTKTGELSVKVSDIELLTKSLRPLPDKFHGLSDKELRYRQRYVDLIMNPEVKETFLVRAKVVDEIRNYLKQHEFLEVETPMMQAIPGGAVAKPFITHHNALDMPLYLRVAPELNLKRLVVGGFDRVFEINRNFRNEGLSTRHNPEFTMLEFYQAYADFEDMMSFTENLLEKVSVAVKGSTEVSYQDEIISFKAPFKRLSITEALIAYIDDVTAENVGDVGFIQDCIKKQGGKTDSAWSLGKAQTELFELVVEEKLIQPTFITHYPVEVSPLSRVNDNNPEIVDRFELFIAGREIANAFSELNDAEDQAERFQSQVAAKDAGDDEAMFYDDDYITALEYGLPPTAGEGIGIDRLVMLLTDSPSIRDVLLFPLMRPRGN